MIGIKGGKEAKEDMHNNLPRYEFRTFAQNFGLIEESLRSFSKLENFRESSEVYIVSADNRKNNVKVRYNTLDIKVLLKEEKGLQQWSPLTKQEFPLEMGFIRDEVFPRLGIAIPKFKRTEYTLDQYLEEIVRPHPELFMARVFKRRFGYIINGCISEIAELTINSEAIKTVSLESVNIQELLQAKDMLGLHGYENVNYILAIKRILGIETLPE
jgi:hypothetical protein